MVRIITDSASDFEPLELQLLDVQCVPMTVSFGDVIYKENVNLTKRMFYNLLKIQNTSPKTSQPSPECFEKIFKEAEEKGDDVVAIFISSKLSGTYQCGKYAGADFKKNIYIIDSLTASAGQRLLVEEAVKMRNKGCTAEEISNHINELKNRLRVFAVVESGDFLKKGGRLPHTAHKINNIKNIKPVIEIQDGEIKLIHKSIGKQRGMQYMIKQLHNKRPDLSYPFHIMYAQNHNMGVVLKETLMNSGYPMSNHSLVNIGAVVGSHIGANSCGIAYIEK